MKRSRLVTSFVALAGVAAVAAAAIGTAQTPGRAPDQRQEVGGWLVEDIAEPHEEDPDRRVVRMSRRTGSDSLAYEVYPGSDGWYGGYDANSNGCVGSHGLDVNDQGAPAERASRTRAVLLARLQDHERFCEQPEGSTLALLDGFDQAYQVLAGWHELRIAERAAEYEQYSFDNSTFDALDAAMNVAPCEGPEC